MKKQVKKTKEIINKIGNISLIILIILIIVQFTGNMTNKNVSDQYIMNKLEKSSELTTAKLKYTGYYHFKDDGIVILNRSDFLMVYNATGRAGIEMKKVKVNTNKLTKTIEIKIPKARVLGIDIDKKQYYDEKFALFNVDPKEDSDRATAKAKENAEKVLAKSGILKMADDQAETLIKGLLQDTIPKDYKIEVKTIN